MAIEVFNRYENKYIINEKIFNRLQNRISDYMELDEFNKSQQTYTVTNLYYDTPDNHLIRASLMKPKYKEKLRLRAYGVTDAGTEAYVEIKKKVAGLVNKRRSVMRLDEAYEFLKTGMMPQPQPCQNRQVLHEIEYILERNALRPALYLAYDRRAHFGIGQHDLRVSFDRNIRSRRYDLSLESGDYGQPLMDEGLWVMEVKVAHSIPVWLCRLLSANKVYPTSFSKYGAEYTRMMEGQKTGMIFDFSPSPQTAVPMAVALNLK